MDSDLQTVVFLAGLFVTGAAAYAATKTERMGLLAPERSAADLSGVASCVDTFGTLAGIAIIIWGFARWHKPWWFVILALIATGLIGGILFARARYDYQFAMVVRGLGSIAGILCALVLWIFA